MLHRTVRLLCRAVYKEPPPLMKFGLWNGTPVPSQWLWSEKLDGIRAAHMSEVSFLETRNGGVLSAPEEFMEYLKGFNRLLTRRLQEEYLNHCVKAGKITAGAKKEALKGSLPHQPITRVGIAKTAGVKLDISIMLDGELWAGRERFQELVSAAKTTRNQNPMQERWSFSPSSLLQHKYPEELLQMRELVQATASGDARRFLAVQEPSKRSEGLGYWGVYFMMFDFLCPPRTFKKHKSQGRKRAGEVLRKPSPVEHFVRVMGFRDRYRLMEDVHKDYVAIKKRMVPVRLVHQNSCSELAGKTYDTAFDLQRALLHHKALDPMQGVPKGNIPEGLMLREPEAPYEQMQRSPAVLKVKPYQEYECLCVGVNEGEGRFQGLVGALQAEGVGHDGQVKSFCAGSGLTDALRVSLRSARRTYDPTGSRRGGYVGRVFTMRCNGYTDAGVPRFPRFVCWRPDRDGAEMLLYGSGMQVDNRPRAHTCVIGEEGRRVKKGELSLQLRLKTGPQAGKTFWVGPRSLPEDIRRSLSRTQSANLPKGDITVQFFSRQDEYGCPLITDWEDLVIKPSKVLKAAKAAPKKAPKTAKKKAADAKKKKATSKTKPKKKADKKKVNKRKR
eukprot:Hpha_TRINITY_DN15488_c3_g8::TRINITY_DN15488_c3_g8_i1::g.175606::m.175606